MSRLSDLKSGVQNLKKVLFPAKKDGVEHPVLVRPATCAELQTATFNTERRFKDEGIAVSVGTSSTYVREETIQVLCFALRDAENPEKPFSASADELRELLTDDELTLLGGMYRDFEREVSPKPDLTSAEFGELVEELKKKPQTILGSDLSSATLKRLVITLASLLATSQTDNGSGSSR
ncbi:MAG: hypothetical protein HY243_12350 [Proteobacteria bacterium]|nr:hypothetical protein [Pseudomonadota bacterium]